MRLSHMQRGRGVGQGRKHLFREKEEFHLRSHSTPGGKTIERRPDRITPENNLKSKTM